MFPPSSPQIPVPSPEALTEVTPHDDGSPFDPNPQNPFAAGTRLLLAPAGAQIYYGDELARPLRVEGARRDPNLHSFMNWEALERGGTTAEIGALAEAGENTTPFAFGGKMLTSIDAFTGLE